MTHSLITLLCALSTVTSFTFTKAPLSLSRHVTKTSKFNPNPTIDPTINPTITSTTKHTATHTTTITSLMAGGSTPGDDEEGGLDLDLGEMFEMFDAADKEVDFDEALEKVKGGKKED
mmetsp:Transcript_21282/g.44324  ORF Transcript_21282/g.44324 Transcript_21282/m.44324 type:complete len:118 (-) Transcript_21282:74-427(-)